MLECDSSAAWLGHLRQTRSALDRYRLLMSPLVLNSSAPRARMFCEQKPSYRRIGSDPPRKKEPTTDRLRARGLIERTSKRLSEKELGEVNT